VAVPGPVDAGAASCHLHVESSPSGADVAFDGEAVGHTPLDIEHACVEINVSVDHARYERFQKKITLTPGTPAEIKASMHHKH
jgi:hypothetical protein